MKTTVIILIVLLAITIVGGCVFFRRRGKTDAVRLTAKLPGKAVIVYYSQSKVRNTAVVASWIQKQLGCELIAIEPVEPYPVAYSQTLKVATQERKDGTQRAIKAVPPLDGFDIVFLGSPIWYGTYAPPMATFLKEHPLADKTLVPFSTHGGGGAPLFEEDIRKACPDATVLKGFTARGSNQIERRLNVGVSSHHTEYDIIEWLNGLFPATDTSQNKGEQDK
jgi:flavodoxin